MKWWDTDFYVLTCLVSTAFRAPLYCAASGDFEALALEGYLEAGDGM